VGGGESLGILMIIPALYYVVNVAHPLQHIVQQRLRLLFLLSRSCRRFAPIHWSARSSPRYLSRFFLLSLWFSSMLQHFHLQQLRLGLDRAIKREEKRLQIHRISYRLHLFRTLHIQGLRRSRSLPSKLVTILLPMLQR
jgi:hypothetical protein